MQYKLAIDFAIRKLLKELPDYHRYHSIEHTLSVIRSSEFLVSKIKANSQEKALLLTAAAYHDIGFTRSPDEHEKVGCEIAADSLPQFGFSAEEIGQIQEMIMATKIPQSPKSKLAEVLCDADLDYLGGDKYGVLSESLFDELGLKGVEMNQKEWLDFQISFLEKHHYWTEFAIRVLAPKKALVLARLKEERASL